MSLQTPEQQQHVKALQYLVQRPLQAAYNAAMLTALTASYRDLYVIIDQLHKKDILGIPRPLLDDPPTASSTTGQQQDQDSVEALPAINHTQMFYPVRDLTKLPDQPEPYGGWLRNHLKQRYMSRCVCLRMGSGVGWEFPYPGSAAPWSWSSWTALHDLQHDKSTANGTLPRWLH